MDEQNEIKRLKREMSAVYTNLLRKHEALQSEMEKAKRDLESAQAACAEMREVLQSIWEVDEMGYIVDDKGYKECGVCGYKDGKHETECLEGVVEHALSIDCGKGWLAPEKVSKAIKGLEAVKKSHHLNHRLWPSGLHSENCSGCYVQRNIDEIITALRGTEAACQDKDAALREYYR